MKLADRSRKTTIMLDIDGIDPTDTTFDITSGSDTLVPCRITLTYAQQPAAAIPQYIEVTVKGYLRDRDGIASVLTNTAEIWRHATPDERPSWVANLVDAELPDWWDQ